MDFGDQHLFPGWKIIRVLYGENITNKLSEFFEHMKIVSCTNKQTNRIKL